MFKILGILFRTTLLAFASLVVGNLLTFDGITLSDHVEKGLVLLNIKHMSMNHGIETIKELPEGARTAADQIKRAWNGVPDLSMKAPGGSAPIRSIPNPHSENHPAASQKDLRRMLQDLKESNERHRQDLQKSGE